MRNFLFFLILLSFFNNPAESIFAQTGNLSGSVFMPIAKKERRTFRGRLYRNRLSSKKKVKKVNRRSSSSFVDVIISAHPISFETKTAPLKNTKIFQKNATFLPRVVPVTLGTIIEFINRDRFFHNVFSISKGSVFNIGRRPTGVIVRRRIEKLGEIKLFCDIHAQMNATIICLDTPYFTRVTKNSRYSLSNLPEGKYEIRVYHPDFPEVSEIVDIYSDKNEKRNFTITK
jgi:plastocyanin